MKKMNIILTIAKKEFVAAFRDRTLWLFAAIAWLLIIFAVLTGWQRQQGLEIQKEKATALFRHEWEEQEANPHSAAHFGTYLFKPSSAMEMYDRGLNSYLGHHYRVEAHIQHEVNHSEAEHSDIHLRFGELSVAMVLQLLLPLMILLLSFNVISKEREGNTLKMLLTQGVKPSLIVWGKIAGIYSIVLAVTLPALLIMAIPMFSGTLLPGATGRYGLFTLAYLLYFFVFTCIGLLLSALSRSSNAALVLSLATWIVLTVLLPRAAVRWIDSANTLPSRHELNRSISQGYQQGLRDDGTALARRKKYLDSTLKKYNVDSVTQLPVNFDGLSMQFGEDYNAKVYEHYSGKVETIIREQQTQLEKFSFTDPFLAVQQISMAMTGSDYLHHLSFHHQAKEYRDEFVRVLNMQLANSGSSYLSYDYKVGPDFFKKMKDFRFQAPSLSTTIQWHKWAFLAILGWCALSFFIIIPLAIRRIKYSV